MRQAPSEALYMTTLFRGFQNLQSLGTAITPILLMMKQSGYVKVMHKLLLWAQTRPG